MNAAERQFGNCDRETGPVMRPPNVGLNSIISPIEEKGGIMRNSRLQLIAEIGLSLALFAVLAMFKFTLPFNIAGGSISLSMLPIIVLAILRGPQIGILAGVLAGFIDFLLEPYSVSALQVILDYPVAFGLLGLAGLLSAAVLGQSKAEGASPKLIVSVLLAAIIGGLARLLAHFLSGVLFFADNTPAGSNVIVYSLTYQLSYMLPSIIAVCILAAIVVPVLVNRVRKEA